MATDEGDTVSEELLNSLVGRALMAWYVSEEGLCFELDDGRKIYIFALAVKTAEEQCLH